MAGMTRGSLPSEVYWRRRLLVLGIALLLVVGFARLLSGGSDGKDPGAGTAAQSGANASVTPSPTAPTDATGEPTAASTAGLTAKQIKKQARKQRRADKAAEKAAAQAAEDAAATAAAAAAAAALSEPQGPCADADVIVTPVVTSAVTGSDVAINLDLRTRFSPACTWTVSPDQLALKITSGTDNIWSTQECPKAVPTQDLVLRRAVTATVQVVWDDAKRSDESCSGRTDWADIGFYHVLAASLCGQPTDLQFELTKPEPAQIVETIQPKADKAAQKAASKAKKKNKQNAR